VLLGVAAVVIVVVLVASRSSRAPEDTASAAGSGEIFLEPAAAPGPDPFTDSAAAPAPPSTVALADPVSLGSPDATAPPLAAPPAAAGGQGGTKSYAGGTPGLYGGTRDKASCDREQMISFLAANPSKARAWADAQGIGVDEVPTYIRSLTPVVLRGDTRVTNYGYSGGRPTARQSVLQAGTAVLVDRFGEPQAKCNCGNPLNAPRAVPTAPKYTGPKWQGFNPGGVTVVVKNTTVINVITIVDITTGTPFGRPTGPNPGPDRALPGAPSAPPPAAAAPNPAPTTGPASGSCQGFTGSLIQTLLIDTASGAPYATTTFEPGRCLRFVFSGEVDLDINNATQGGYDSIWCYDPKYCPTPKAEIFLMSGGYQVWKVFGVPAPPLATDHRYTFTIRTETAGPVAFQLGDRSDDNRGTLKIEVYG
jgi:hypothetical protein